MFENIKPDCSSVEYVENVVIKGTLSTMYAGKKVLLRRRRDWELTSWSAAGSDTVRLSLLLLSIADT